MPLFPQAVKDFLQWEDAPKSNNIASVLDRQVSKKSIVAVGTMRAGKTTFFAGLGATAQYKASDSAHTENRFRFIPNEQKTNLLEDIAELRSGRFPEATKVLASTTIKPSFAFEWEDPTFFGSRFNIIRRADLPIIDFAGEELMGLSAAVKNAKTIEEMSSIKGTDQLTVTVNQASALLLIINAERAEGLPIFKPEPWQQIKGMSKHPDVNMQRVTSPIIEWKHDNKKFTPPLERVGVVITACDRLFPIAELISGRTGRPFKPLDPQLSNQALDSFMKAFFPGTHSLIASLNLDVQYFPSYFELEGADRNNIQYWDEAKTQPKIKRGNIFDSPDWEHNVNRPVYTEYWFNRVIEWIKGIATRV